MAGLCEVTMGFLLAAACEVFMEELICLMSALCSLPAFILSTRPVCTVLKHITIDMHKYAFEKWAFSSDSEFCLTHEAGAMVEGGPSLCVSIWLVEISAFYKCFLLRKHFLSLCLYQVVLAGVGKGCFVLGVGSGVWLTISVFWCRSNSEV